MSHSGAALAAAGLLAVLVAACGSGSSTTPSSASAAASQTTTSTTSVSPSATPSTTATATLTSTGTSASSSTSASSTGSPSASASSVPGCGNAQIAVALGRGAAGLGHAGFPLLFTNTSSQTCALTGYPGAALVTSSGTEIQVARTPQGYLGGLLPQDKTDPVVRLAPGQTAAALLEGNDASASGGRCPVYTTLLVTPPNTTATHHLTMRGALTVCNPTIHPVVTGTSGAQRG